MVIDKLCTVLISHVAILLFFSSLLKSSSMETLVIQDAVSIDTTLTEEQKKSRHACNGINYGWIIVAASFLVLIINYGVIHSW